ncbi:MAG: NAD(P)/FAD-dependent oxidoreductase, partial [Deltaproteobacteria bacterium]|nr:NAD(P)/FAD-dependent oxidoreductase [Deltaproteobacteria bacterium]
MRTTTDVVVIGGGLTGLAAATFLARAGRGVTLFDKAHEVGGRALTQAKSGFRFNLGPHALYRGGPGIRILRELGVPFTGSTPSASGGYALDHGTAYTLPAGFVSLLTTGLLRLPGKLETARLLGSLAKIDAQSVQHLTVQEWLEQAIRQPEVRSLVQALFRVATYTNDPERQSAGTALAQLQMALTSNVLYLDGGWQILVDGLRAAAQTAGVHIETGKRAVSLEYDSTVHGLRLADGSTLNASAVIITGSPADAAALVPNSEFLHQWADTAIPVKAACLDIGLARLPRPRALFALGIDRPLYFSVHSAVAKLGPDGGAVIHAAKYLHTTVPTDPKADEQELEGVLDSMQPGWREIVVERRFLPHMIVSHLLVTAAAGGTGGRPGPAVPGIHNLYVAGDWVGPEGLLADASLASAKRAAELVVRSEEI